jgi:hypothetical protein
MIHSSVVFASLCFGSITTASTVELQVTGEVTTSTFASVPVGTTLTADLFYDPSTAAINSAPDNAQYPLPQQPFLDFAGSTLTFPAASVVTTLIENTINGFQGIPTGDDAIYWVGTLTSADATGPIASDPSFDATGISSVNIYFAAPHGNGVLTSAALPPAFPALSQWTISDFYYLPVNGACEGTCGNFSGTITSVEVVTPEPGGVFLSALCWLPAVLLAHRRFRTRAAKT